MAQDPWLPRQASAAASRGLRPHLSAGNPPLGLLSRRLCQAVASTRGPALTIGRRSPGRACFWPVAALALAQALLRPLTLLSPHAPPSLSLDWRPQLCGGGWECLQLGRVTGTWVAWGCAPHRKRRWWQLWKNNSKEDKEEIPLGHHPGLPSLPSTPATPQSPGTVPPASWPVSTSGWVLPAARTLLLAWQSRASCPCCTPSWLALAHPDLLPGAGQEAFSFSVYPTPAHPSRSHSATSPERRCLCSRPPLQASFPSSISTEAGTHSLRPGAVATHGWGLTRM